MKKLIILEKIVAWGLVILLVMGFITMTALMFFGAYTAFELLMSVKNQ
jgi:hypothetical protein